MRKVKGKQTKGCTHWSIQVYTPVLTNGRIPLFVYLSHEIDNAFFYNDSHDRLIRVCLVYKVQSSDTIDTICGYSKVDKTCAVLDNTSTLLHIIKLMSFPVKLRSAPVPVNCIFNTLLRF